MLGKTIGELYDYCCFHYRERTALTVGDEKITFWELEERGIRLANSLVDLGFAKGDTVAMMAPNIMLGYLNRPELTAETIVDGWLHTGDVAYQDEEGYLYIVDRKKDMIVSGGFNIFPKEVEDALGEHPAVAISAVIGVPHEKWGEAIKAVVQLKPGKTATEEELIQLVKAKKGSLMAPKSVDFVDVVPVTLIGKLDKKALRVKYWEGKERRV